MDFQIQDSSSQPAYQPVVAKIMAPRLTNFQNTSFRFFLLDFVLHLKGHGAEIKNATNKM